MSRTRFLTEITNSLLPGEDFDDVVTLIDILAIERRKVVGFCEREDEFSFAAAIICVILKPFKPPTYVNRMEALRMGYRRISISGRLQATYRNSFTPTLLNAPTALQAINAGFDVLFS